MRQSGIDLTAVFRANPRYELVPLHGLDAAERSSVESEHDDHDDLYGILRPRAGSGLPARLVSADTALLFFTLAEAATLPRFVRARLGAGTGRTVGRLVADGILEVDQGAGFVWGAQALASGTPAGGRNAELSAAALRYGQNLRAAPEDVLAERLYYYGRVPASAGQRRAWPDEDAVDRYLGVDRDGALAAALDRHWSPVSASGDRRHWRQWRTRSASAAIGEAPADAIYKLYVSATVAQAPVAVRTVVTGVGAARGVIAFKVGAGLVGLCRPDKLVVYFRRLDDLWDGAVTVTGQLAGCAAQGVPFTAAVTADGLLSWGVDPPAGMARRTSWRMWLARRLAEHLSAARDDGPAALEPWQYALERLRLSGIDPETWIPSPGLWADVLASE